MEEINENDLIKYAEIIERIKDQFLEVCSTDIDFYSKYDFEISNEQFYVPDEDRAPGKIYIVVKFQPASVDYGTFQIPITIQAISEANGLSAAQRLLLEYAQIWNLKKSKENGKLIYQYYQAPSVVSNFDMIYDGFRSVLVTTGTFFVSEGINLIGLKYFKGETAKTVDEIPHAYVADLIQYGEEVYRWDEDSDTHYVLYEGEDVDVLNYSDTFSATPDTQPYYKSKNFTKTEVKYGTLSFNLTTFLTDDYFLNLILKIIYKKEKLNYNFYFRMIQDNGITSDLTRYKLISCHREQNKAELPVVSMSFTE